MNLADFLVESGPSTADPAWSTAVDACVERFDNEFRYATSEVELVGSAPVRASVEEVSTGLFALIYATQDFHSEHEAWNALKVGLIAEMRADVRASD